MGRPKSPGKRYYLGRVRYNPIDDPPELLDLLEIIAAAPGQRKGEIIKAALLSGRHVATQEANRSEDDLETDALIDDLFG